MGVAGPNHIFVSHGDGVIRRYGADGTLIDDNFFSVGAIVPLAVAPGGPFGTKSI